MNLENSFDGKDYVCGRMLQFLMEVTGGGENPSLVSFQLLETLLYRVHLSLFTGRHQNALVLLQVTCKLPPQECFHSFTFLMHVTGSLNFSGTVPSFRRISLRNRGFCFEP